MSENLIKKLYDDLESLQAGYILLKMFENEKALEPNRILLVAEGDDARQIVKWMELYDKMMEDAIDYDDNDVLVNDLPPVE